MSSEQHKVDVQSLSSLSIDPNQMGLGNSNIFGGRKSSFDYVNILKDSDQLPRKDFRNSLDILTSNINTSKPTNAPLKQIIQLYNQQNKVKIQQSGFKALQIGQVFSQSEQQQRPMRNHFMQPQIPLPQSRIKLETVYNQSKFNYHSYFPHDLAQVLKQRQIPLQYVRGLLMVRDQKQIKTTRKLKVQRYLQKRRKKTWNRKICYNCRQKVAQQRLRIKGKFIKKRRAMQILGLTIPIDTALLKQKLYAALKNKDNAQIEQLLKAAKKQKGQNSDEDEDEDQDINEDDEMDEQIMESDQEQNNKRMGQMQSQDNQIKNNKLNNLNPNPAISKANMQKMAISQQIQDEEQQQEQDSLDQKNRSKKNRKAKIIAKKQKQIKQKKQQPKPKIRYPKMPISQEQNQSILNMAKPNKQTKPKANAKTNIRKNR